MIATEVLSSHNTEGRSPTGRGDLMVVDDQPANLKLMEDMLRREGYTVRSFPRGRMALHAAGQFAPDLILLDINMPEMDGFDVCARLKADKKLASIPVIFLSALDETEDKVRAFRSGGVDYVTKPFQFDEVHARIETQLELQRARQAERQLLENTLTGAVKTLADLIQQTEPALAARSEAIRATVVHLTSKMELDAPWQYELGAILCLIGCIALPADVFERAYGRAPKGSDEEIFRTHPETGARLLAKIPRLEIVCEMIRQQQTAIGDSQPVSPAELGARMLRIAIELDRWIFRGISVEAALGQLKAVPHGFPPEMIEALKDYSPPRTATEIKDLQVKDLLVSMITEQDIVTNDGNFMIVRKGSVLNAPILEKVRNFDQTRGIRQPIRVQIPQSNDNHGLQ